MQNHGFTKFFISAFKGIIHKVNSSIFDICKEHQFNYIDNNNVYGNLLHKDGLHLLYAGKELLRKNFVVGINNFLDKRIYHPKIYLDRMTVV